jgi:hypothetical protein
VALHRGCVVLTALCVLRSGGDYDVEDVIRLRDGFDAYLPGIEFVCLSDVDIPGVTTVPLIYGWPRWWAKMEICAPDIRGDVLYADLDTMVVGDLTPLASIGRLTVLDNWDGDGGIGSGLMYLTESDRLPVWEMFTADPAVAMQQHSNHRRHGWYGDQGFFRRFWQDKAARWQTELPGMVLSYKRDRVPEQGLSDAARVVVFHGKPRPRDIGWRLPSPSRK